MVSPPPVFHRPKVPRLHRCLLRGYKIDGAKSTHIRDSTFTKNLILNLVGTSLERIEERKKIFQGLEAYFREDETYDNFLSLLFDLEESFIS